MFFFISVNDKINVKYSNCPQVRCYQSLSDNANALTIAW